MKYILLEGNDKGNVVKSSKRTIYCYDYRNVLNVTKDDSVRKSLN